MRIIGGRLGGRRFDGPASNATRPTSDRVREGVASALEARDVFRDAVVLDLFAGTGGWAFEAMSRGAVQAVLVDRDRRACDQINKNAASLGVQEQARVITADLLRDSIAFLKRVPSDMRFTLVFVDPPYAEIAKVPALLAAIIKHGAVADDALFVLERASRDPAPTADFLAAVATYRYGDTAVDLFGPRPETPSPASDDGALP